MASRSAASAPNSGATDCKASLNPLQKRTGFWSARSHDSQHVVPGGRAATQLDNSRLLPAPAEPTTTVRRLPAPAVSRSCSAGLATSVAGSAMGRNFAKAKRMLGENVCSADTTPSGSSAGLGIPSQTHAQTGRKSPQGCVVERSDLVHPPVGDDAGPRPQACWDSANYEKFTTKG